MAAFSRWPFLQAEDDDWGFFATFPPPTAALTTRHVATGSWEQLQRRHRSDCTEQKMSLEPATRSEVFGQLRKELYGEEHSSGSDTHIFIILGASVSTPSTLHVFLTFQQNQSLKEISGGTKKQQQQQRFGGTDGRWTECVWGWQTEQSSGVRVEIRLRAKMCRINLFHCQSMKSEALFVPCHKFWNLHGFFLFFFLFPYLLVISSLNCTKGQRVLQLRVCSKVQHCTINRLNRHCLLTSLLFFSLKVLRLFCSNSEQRLIVPHSLACLHRAIWQKRRSILRCGT